MSAIERPPVRRVAKAASVADSLLAVRYRAKQLEPEAAFTQHDTAISFVTRFASRPQMLRQR